MSLSTSEEQLMQILWEKGRAYMKDLVDAYEEPKPALTTIATLLKRLQEKNCVDYKQKGRSREYFPLVKKKEYFGKQMKGMIKNFFNNDAHQFASYFTETTDLNEEQLKELRNLIDQQLQNK